MQCIKIYENFPLNLEVIFGEIPLICTTLLAKSQTGCHFCINTNNIQYTNQNQTHCLVTGVCVYNKGASKMFSNSKTFSLLLLGGCMLYLVHTSAGSCWETWSRCSRWSSAATGYLWLSCDNCCKCKGKASGSCKLVSGSRCWLTGSSRVYRCICKGTRSGRKPGICSDLSNAAFSCE